VNVPKIIASVPGLNENSLQLQGGVMLSYRLVRVVEYHADSLAASLVHKVHASERTTAYRNIPSEELKARVHEIYHHLGKWMIDRSAPEIEQLYIAIGSRLAEQGVPLSELIWAITLTKQNLCEYIDDVTFPGRITELADKQEILQLLNEFFDEATHAAAVGYEWAAEEQAKKGPKPHNTGDVVHPASV
jgi:hypothetical protein